ncbi:hypothetical protein [Lysobacter gummosus]|uniref:hypothetical protein n=1 Tax=Lysobacter gummosus TaxID=262324 RepID=UPI00363C2099
MTTRTGRYSPAIRGTKPPPRRKVSIRSTTFWAARQRSSRTASWDNSSRRPSICRNS